MSVVVQLNGTGQEIVIADHFDGGNLKWNGLHVMDSGMDWND